MRLGVIGNNSLDRSSTSGIFTPEERVAYEKTVGNIQYYNYNSKNKSVLAQDTQSTELFFHPDGTKLYVLGAVGFTIYQYTLSTAWDVSTATYASKSFVSSAVVGDTSPEGFFITPDGSTLYLLGVNNDQVYQLKLTTPWDISTVIQPNVYNIVSQVAAATATGVKFGDSGTKMYVISSSTNEIVYQYTLSTAWDILTASYASKSLTITTQDALMNDITFSSDGTKLYAIGDTNNTIYQYTLSTAWDISTGSYASKSLSVGTQDTVPTAFVFSSDGTKGYVAGDTNNTIYQYTFSVAWDVSTGSYASKSLAVGTQATNPQALCFNSTGTSLYIINDGSGATNAIFQYTLSTAWDVSTATYASKSIGTFDHNYYYEATPTGLDISSDGTKIYFVGQNYGSAGQSKVFYFPLNTAGDISTANTFWYSIAAQDNSGRGIQFNPDGTKMFLNGPNGTAGIYQYSLSTPWSIGSLSYDSVKLLTGSQDTSISGFCFNRSGTKLVICGITNDKLYQYNLTTPWNISTASFFKSIDVSLFDTVTTAVCFSNLDHKIYITGWTNDTIYQFDLAF